MRSYETSATVQLEGTLHLDHLPFAPGTEVEVRGNPKQFLKAEESSTTEIDLETVRTQMRELFRTVKGFQNTALLKREELYDR